MVAQPVGDAEGGVIFCRRHNADDRRTPHYAMQEEDTTELWVHSKSQK